jgi:hypothetical protein
MNAGFWELPAKFSQSLPDENASLQPAMTGKYGGT